MDLSDRDGPSGVSIFAPKLGQPFEGLRMADGIAAYRVKGKDYFVTANEGDGREYGTYLDEERGSGSGQDTTAYRVKLLADDANVGSDDRITTFGGRSNDKGVEPEGVVVAKLDRRTYAIVSMERTTQSMLAVFDVTDPTAVRFVTSTVIAGSVSAEGLHLVDAKQSPTGRAQLIVSNEVSNTLNVFDLEALITNGEFTNGTAPGSGVYVPPGIFDGQGAFSKGDGTYTLLVNHELVATAGYASTAEGLNPSVKGARISRFIVDIDADDKASNGFLSRILSGGLAYDKVIGGDTDGFDRFCSANLVEASHLPGG